MISGGSIPNTNMTIKHLTKVLKRARLNSLMGFTTAVLVIQDKSTFTDEKERATNQLLTSQGAYIALTIPEGHCPIGTQKGYNHGVPQNTREQETLQYTSHNGTITGSLHCDSMCLNRKPHMGSRGTVQLIINDPSTHLGTTARARGRVEDLNEAIINSVIAKSNLEGENQVLPPLLSLS
jgi:hypothetical protein